MKKQKVYSLCLRPNFRYEDVKRLRNTLSNVLCRFPDDSKEIGVSLNRSELEYLHILVKKDLEELI